MASLQLGTLPSWTSFAERADSEACAKRLLGGQASFMYLYVHTLQPTDNWSRLKVLA